MSGVSRLRAAKKGTTLPIEHVAQKTEAYGGAKDVSDKNFGAPKKKGAWDKWPTTGVPEGNESPHRGENTNPGNRARGMR